MKKEFMIGKTKIIIDTSYIDSRTEEQAKMDHAMLTDAVWNLYDKTDEEMDIK